MLASSGIDFQFCLDWQLELPILYFRINNIPTLTRVNEEVNPHDIEYPDIPSIPEEQEEEQDQPSPVSNSPVNFPEFSPETELVKPWKGILKKSSSVNVNSSMY